jgi:glucose/arabinose dehydrogenase
MRKRLLTLVALLAIALAVFFNGSRSTETATVFASDAPKVALEPFLPDFKFDRPTHLAAAPDGSGRLFVCEQRGVVWMIQPAHEGQEATRSIWLDLRKKTRMVHNEEGLLSIAFHPKFKENGRVFAAYSTGSHYYPTASTRPKKDPVRTCVSAFKLERPDAPTVPVDSEKVVIQGEKPWGNHNGGQIAFGPDGMLYFGLGDGGAGGDPERNGQDLSRRLAKIHRIDVDKGDSYAIPKDNPFVGVDGALPEIWAYGLRNPWRFSFDRETGALWVGDVGQDKRESVKKVERGTNQGWSIMEGNLPFRGGTPRDPIVPPVWDYGRRDGASITGGFVYRGKRIPSLLGVYVFGDYVSGNIFGLHESKNDRLEVWKLIERSGKAPSSFGEDEDGELYLVHHADEYGGLFKLRPAG